MQALISESIYSNSQSTTQLLPIGINSIGILSSSIILSPKKHFSEKIAEMFQKLDRISKLESNWDSYNSLSPSKIAIENARNFLIENHSLSLPFYFLAPEANGGIMIEFQKENKAAELFFLPNDETELVLYKLDEVELEGTLHDNLYDMLHFFNNG